MSEEFSDGMSSDIRSYLHGGGNLIAALSLNGLDIGVNETSVGVLDNADPVIDTASPITHNVTSVDINNGSTFRTLDHDGALVDVVKANQTSSHPNESIVSVGTLGQGKFMYAGVGGLWTASNLDTADHKTLLNNYLTWAFDSSALTFAISEGNNLHQLDNLYSDLNNQLTGLGHIVYQFDREPTHADFNMLDIFYLNGFGVNSEFSSAMSNATMDFVSNGGGLIMAGDSNGIDVGIQTSTTLNNLDNHTSTLNPQNRLLNGINKLNFSDGSVVYDIETDELFVDLAESDKFTTPANQTLLGMTQIGMGKVMVSATPTLFTSALNLDDNSLLINNYIDWYMDDSDLFFVIGPTSNSLNSLSGNYFQMADFLVQAGHTPYVLEQEPTSQILDNVDIFMLTGHLDSSYSTSSIAAVENYVENGGGLIIVGKTRGVDVGIEFSSPSNLFESYEIIDQNHPVTSNVSAVAMGNGAVYYNMSHDGSYTELIWRDQFDDSTTESLLAVKTLGKGRIMATGVLPVFGAGFASEHNPSLLANFIQWHQTPVELSETTETKTEVSSDTTTTTTTMASTETVTTNTGGSTTITSTETLSASVVFMTIVTIVISIPIIRKKYRK